MLIDTLINKQDGRKSELRQGINGSGNVIFSIQWESGWIDADFHSEDEARNWAEQS